MEQDLFDDKPLIDLRRFRKTKKNVKKPNMKISRKAVLRVEEDLKAEYRKYVNSIKRRKLCKVKSFRVFANERMGKKTRRNVKKAVTPKPVQSFFSSSSPAPVETPVVSPAPEEESVPAETPVVSPAPVETPAQEQQEEEQVSSETSTSTPAPEEEGNSIVKSITDSLGLSSPKKTGGKKHKRKNNRSRK